MQYTSRIKLLGLPLVHIATGQMQAGQYVRGMAKGWIAIGDAAFGILFAAGGVAIGGIALGGVSVGVLSCAGLAIGVFALGGAAIGIEALGGAALAWHAAYGGLAMAQEYAVGGGAFAHHANNETAQHYMNDSLFFSAGYIIMHNAQWFLLLTLIPLVQAVRRKNQNSNKGTK